MFKKILVTGGAGYVGAALTPKLLDQGYQVRVLDLYLYNENVFEKLKNHPRLEQIKGDLRDRVVVKKALEEVDAVIHLACISNDPSFELDPELGRSINYDAFKDLVELSLEAKIKRFIYASSSSVYGVKQDENVTEDLALEPLTDYSKYKALCEEYLLSFIQDEFTILIVRPATVCGYSDRLRLDLTVNILTNHAVNNRKIKVFGGTQRRPNIHIDDMVRFYLHSLQWDHEKIHRKIYNVGYENYSLNQIADLVRERVGMDIQVEVSPTDDLRSYHISSQKIKNELGFVPQSDIRKAIGDLVVAFQEGKIPESMHRSSYYNIKKMQEINLS